MKTCMELITLVKELLHSVTFTCRVCFTRVSYLLATRENPKLDTMQESNPFSRMIKFSPKRIN